MAFKLESTYQPTGDQPEAIKNLSAGIMDGDKAQVLLGVTGSGKTFTIANVIAKVNKPTLVITHNKTLTAQLYGEFREFFPDNAIEYFRSEEHTSELQSRGQLVCRLLLEKTTGIW